MAPTHAQQFANQTLPRAVFRDPLAFTRALAGGGAAGALALLWEHAGTEIARTARVPGHGWVAQLEQRGLYAIAIVTPPAPRVTGDPAMIAIVGRGDGVGKLSTVTYYVLELVLDPTTPAPRFRMVARSGIDERAATWSAGSLPDPRWVADTAFALFTGRLAEAYTGVPELPCWYWWYTFDGAAAMQAFERAAGDAERVEVVRDAPILLLPEIADAAETYLGELPARRLRELRPYLLRSPGFAPCWWALVERLASASAGSAAAHATRALPLIAEASQRGALTRAQAYELEAVVRSKLAAIGVDPQDNYELSEHFFAAARAAAQAPRLARGSAPPPLAAEDPMWRPLFLDDVDLPQCVRTEHDEVATSAEPTFLTCGGVRAGYAAWSGPDSSPLGHVVDARWVFRTAAGAAAFVHAMAPVLGGGLPMHPAPQLGDHTLAFADDTAITNGSRRTHVMVMRVGRVVARLHATEGAHAAAARQALHAAMLHPLADTIMRRARKGLAAYWLSVASPSNAVAAFLHSPGYDAAQLLHTYPLLAHPELASALALLGERFAPAARSLASFQAQLRAHRWAAYREAMRALVRALLDAELGDLRVNAAEAHTIVTELRQLDPDPIWLQLDMECRARG